MYKIYAKYRDEADLKDTDVAEATGVSKATLSQWKHGKYTPKADKLLKIARLLHIPVETLIEGE